MSPELYFAVMLITNPQKARRILLAEELENWFMDLFDDEFEDILDGTFKDNQEFYIDRIIDKYLEITGVSITATDEYSKSVIDRAVKMASEIQDTTWKNLTVPYLKRKSDSKRGAFGTIQNITQITTQTTIQSQGLLGSDDYRIEDFIRDGIAIGATLFATETIKRWLGQERANLIALNEANWRWNNEEFFDAKSSNKKKTWRTALDERVRFTHMELEGVTIGIDENFNVGGYPALYPCATTLPIHESANCRCTLEYK